VLSRRPQVRAWRVVPWDGRSVGHWQREVDDCDVVINLAGRNVNCRYTRTFMTMPTMSPRAFSVVTNRVLRARGGSAFMSRVRGKARLWRPPAAAHASSPFAQP
jgi:hypothetical protein